MSDGVFNKDSELKVVEQATSEPHLPAEIFKLSDKSVREVQKKIDFDPRLKQSIIKDTVSIEIKKKHWAKYSEEGWSSKSLISVGEFLQNTSLVEKNKRHLKKVWNRKWHEYLKWSDIGEKNFLSKVRSILPGKQVEVMQISTFANRSLLKQAVAVGSGEYISKSELDKATNKLELSTDTPSEVYLVHNHFDEYQDLKLPTDSESRDGLVTVGGLSKSDIEFADKFLDERTKGNAKVYIVAANERGLTFTYEAGTSKHRDWENDNE